jgi:ATP synthase protein I
MNTDPNLTKANEVSEQASKEKHANFAHQIGTKAARKIKAQRNHVPGVWFGLGMMGLVGWSIVIPTLLGATLGIWLDKHQSDEHSWTLALIIAGLTIGCFNAWHWVDKEDKAMREDQRQNETKVQTNNQTNHQAKEQKNHDK